jgi:hypothetical protein
MTMVGCRIGVILFQVGLVEEDLAATAFFLGVSLGFLDGMYSIYNASASVSSAINRVFIFFELRAAAGAVDLGSRLLRTGFLGWLGWRLTGLVIVFDGRGTGFLPLGVSAVSVGRLFSSQIVRSLASCTPTSYWTTVTHAGIVTVFIGSGSLAPLVGVSKLLTVRVLSGSVVSCSVGWEARCSNSSGFGGSVLEQQWVWRLGARTSNGLGSSVPEPAGAAR